MKDIFNKKETLIEVGSPWLDMKYFYDGSENIEYICRHLRLTNAPESDPGWYLTKLTWSNGFVTRVQNRRGTVDGHTTGWS
jgi:hypothetical protein